MKEKRPLILIANDDGYQAKGINCLIDMLRDMADLIVCAPDAGRSGFACAFSATKPLRLEKVREEEGLQVWWCNGTPVDCVKMALHCICPRRPDMIVGGINHGDNASVNTHYSGTMGVVMEGCMKYIPSVAFSLCDFRADADFEPMRDIVRELQNGVIALLPLIRGEVVTILRHGNNLFLNLPFRISRCSIEEAFSLEFDKVSVDRATVCPVALRRENRRWINALEMQTVF